MFVHVVMYSVEYEGDVLVKVFLKAKCAEEYVNQENNDPKGGWRDFYYVRKEVE